MSFGIHTPIKGDLGQMVQHVQMIREMLSHNPRADSQASSPQKPASEEIQPGDLAGLGWGDVCVCF